MSLTTTAARNFKGTTTHGRTEGESFADWVQRADEDLLRGERALEAVS